jgi:hypothetical protein
LTQALAHVTEAVYDEVREPNWSERTMAISSIDFDPQVLITEWCKWGVNIEKFTVSCDIACYPDYDYEPEEEYTYELWRKVEFTVTLPCVGNTHSATASRIPVEGRWKSEIITVKNADPILEILKDKKWEIEEAK